VLAEVTVADGGDRAGEEAAAERGPRDEADVELARRREQVRLDRPPHRPFDLHRRYRVDGVRLPELGGGDVRQPEVRTSPSWTRSATAPTVSASGTCGSGKCG
jgi:hypothetical protein